MKAGGVSTRDGSGRWSSRFGAARAEATARSTPRRALGLDALRNADFSLYAAAEPLAKLDRPVRLPECAAERAKAAAAEVRAGALNESFAPPPSRGQRSG